MMIKARDTTSNEIQWNQLISSPMKKSLHRNVLSCAASPLKLSELESSKQICYQVAASPLNSCALLQAEMITINKLNLKLKVSLHRNKCPSSPLPMHKTSS
jgi:hypothetical protein